MFKTGALNFTYEFTSTKTKMYVKLNKNTLEGDRDFVDVTDIYSEDQLHWLHKRTKYRYLHHSWENVGYALINMLIMAKQKYRISYIKKRICLYNSIDDHEFVFLGCIYMFMVGGSLERNIGLNSRCIFHGTCPWSIKKGTVTVTTWGNAGLNMRRVSS